MVFVFSFTICLFDHFCLHFNQLAEQSTIVVCDPIEIDLSSQGISDADGNTPLYSSMLNYKGSPDEAGSKNNQGFVALIVYFYTRSGNKRLISGMKVEYGISIAVFEESY